MAVNRLIPDQDEEPLGGSDEKISLASAMTAYTAGSAYINHREASTGRISVGYLADLVVLDRDPFQHPPQEIYRTTVASTWIEGARAFER